MILYFSTLHSYVLVEVSFYDEAFYHSRSRKDLFVKLFDKLLLLLNDVIDLMIVYILLLLIKHRRNK